MTTRKILMMKRRVDNPHFRRYIILMKTNPAMNGLWAPFNKSYSELTERNSFRMTSSLAQPWLGLPGNLWSLLRWVLWSVPW